MEEITVPGRWLRAVEPVSGHRMPDRRHMGADLVRAAGAEADPQQGESGELLYRLPVGSGRATPGQPGSHAGPVPGISRDGLLDATVAFEFSLHQRQIDFFHLSRRELR